MRSSSAPASATTTKASGRHSHEGHAELLHREHGEIAARHREGAMREVDEVHQPQRHGQPHGEHEQQHAVGDAVEKDGEHAECLKTAVLYYRRFGYRTATVQAEACRSRRHRLRKPSTTLRPNGLCSERPGPAVPIPFTSLSPDPSRP